MESFSFNASGLSDEVTQQISGVHQTLKDKFGIQPTGHINFQLEQFKVFSAYSSFSLRNSYVIKEHDQGNDSYVLFVDTHHTTQTAKNILTDNHQHQIWALAYLAHNMGRVLIRPETLYDKIFEVIHPLELDFDDDKAFSDAFYVVADDYEKATAGITRNFRNAVMDIRHDDLIIEIVEHTLIIGNNKPMSATKAVQMASFVSRLCSQK